MKYPLFLLLFLFNITCQAQDDENVTVTAHEILTGTDLHDNTNIKGTRYTLAYDIYDSYIDSNKNEMLLVLRKPKKKHYYGKSYYEDGAYIAMFDLVAKKIIWTKKLRSTNFHVTDTKIIETIDGEGSFCFSKTDGKRLWKSSARIYYTDSNTGIAINEENALNGIDLNTGISIWERTLKGNNPELDNIVPLNDSVVLTLSQGLQTINLRTGEGWAHKLAINNSYTPAGSVLTSALVGGLTGALFGVAVIPSYTHGIISHHSQVFIHSNKIYFATPKTLLCYDFNGNEIWTQPLPKEYIGNSYLFAFKNNIVMVSKGHASIGGVVVKHGTGFWASFDKNTGKKTTDFTSMDNAGFQDYIISNDTLLVLTDSNYIYMYRLEDGQQLFNRKLDLNPEAAHRFFTGRDIYTCSSGSSCISLDMQIPANYFIASLDTGMIFYDLSFKKLLVMPFQNLWTTIDNYKGYRLLNNTGDSSVFVKDDHIKARLKITESAILINNTLYNMGRNYFTITDMAGIIR